MVDAVSIIAGHRPTGDYGTLNGNIIISFDKESVNYGDRWGNRINIFTSDSDVESTHKAFINLKNICNKKKNPELFSE